MIHSVVYILEPIGGDGGFVHDIPNPKELSMIVSQWKRFVLS